jgi:hypothetical protein
MNVGFKYYPEKLFSKPVKMLNITAKAFGMSKPVEAFYSIKDGAWNDIATWETVSGRMGKLPSLNDDVYIRHNVIFSSSLTLKAANLFINNYATLSSSGVSSTLTVKNLNIAPAGTYIGGGDSMVLQVTDCIKSFGLISFPGVNQYFNISGYNNQIDNFLSGTGVNTVTYNGAAAQYVLPLSYNNLELNGVAGVIRYFTSSLVIKGTFRTFNCTAYLGSNMLTVNGATTVGSLSYLLANEFTNIVFIGKLTVQTTGIFDFRIGNPTVELRAGVHFGDYGIASYTGTGQWTLTTNNQDVSNWGGGSGVFDCPILISGAITVTLPSSYQIVFNNPSVTGDNVASKLVVNATTLYLNTTTTPMATGIFDFTTYSNVISYSSAASMVLPSTVYKGLQIQNGAKTLGGNTSVTSLRVEKFGVLDAGIYDFTNTGATVLAFLSGGVGTIKKTGAGNMLFVGLIDLQNYSVIDFRIGNPNVELRGGLQLNDFGLPINSGTGQWSFTTNNQSIINGSANPHIFDGPILISGAITVTASLAFTFNNSINGNNALSTFDTRCAVGAGFGLNYKNAVAPMATGVLQANAGANIFRYNSNTNQDVKGGTYRTLEFGGSGVKTLLGNVVVNTTAGGSWSITGSALINYNGFTITTI